MSSLPLGAFLGLKQANPIGSFRPHARAGGRAARTGQHGGRGRRFEFSVSHQLAFLVGRHGGPEQPSSSVKRAERRPYDAAARRMSLMQRVSELRG